MSILQTLTAAILCRRAVKIRAKGWEREVCPHALGYRDGRCKVLTYQYSGGSASGLAADGGWRCFVLQDILRIEITDGAWHTSHDYVAKLETSFNSIDCQTRPLVHVAD